MEAERNNPHPFAHEPLVFEQGGPGKCGVALPDSDVPDALATAAFPAALLRDPSEELPFPELGEFEVVRHFTHLAARLFSVDANFYPLGSCTMWGRLSAGNRAPRPGA